MRADAQRNYDAIVRAAAVEVERVGADASLEDIARNAGVGSATLHRRFRTRRALLQAVFVDRITTICEHADVLSARMGAGEALEAWLRELARFSASTRGVADALILGTVPDPATSACETMLISTASSLHARALERGEVSATVSALDLLALVNSLSLGSRTAPNPVEYAERLLGLALDGIRR